MSIHDHANDYITLVSVFKCPSPCVRFDIFDCGRKMALVALPIFLPADSPEQLTLGLILCFVTFGMYMMYAPFIDDGDDFLSQICQMQIFFSLLSTIILKTEPNSPVMAVILPILICFPPISGFILESGVLDELKKISSPDDNGWPIPFTGGTRVGVGLRSKSTACLERLLGVKKAPEELVEDDGAEDDGVAEATTASSLGAATPTAADKTRLFTPPIAADSNQQNMEA